MYHREARFILHLLIIVSLLAIFAPLPVAAQETIHVVQPGETLFRIGLRYSLSVDTLAQTNGLADASHIFAGQRLTIPSPGAASVDSTAFANPLVAAAPSNHVVQPGETLAEIAQQYGLTADQLATSNKISDPNHIFSGQSLSVWDTQNSTAAAPTPARIHTVLAGEYLSEIAQNYRTSASSIIAANNLTNPDRLLVGQQLSIPGVGDAVFGGTSDLGIVEVSGARPTTVVGKQIVVDLSDSQIYAYEDGRLLNNVIVSTGLPRTPTVVGDFNIYWKLEKQTMYGDDFYLEDVPWVMYFFEGYAIHGTYWHNNFGNPMSHGCVNLRTPDAGWFFQWAEVGTPVHVQA